MAIIVITLLLFALALLGPRYGVDSRDGLDWADRAADRP
jgi:hypothetical protein